MIDLDNVREIWQTISRNKARSVLTAFGVFWGIFILVLLTSVGRGIENGLLNEFKGFAANSALMFAQPTTVAYKGYPVGRQWNLKSEDITILKERIPQLQHVVPVISRWYNSENSNTIYGNKHGNYNLRGTTPEYNLVDHVITLSGRYINQLDINSNRKVCVIGKRVADEMFGNDNPIDKLLKFNGVYYLVVGVVKAVNEHININGNNSQTITIPLTTMQRMYNMGDVIHFMLFSTDGSRPITTYEPAIQQVIKEHHKLAPNDNEAADIMDFYKFFKQFNSLFVGLNALIWVVGLGTLLSGVVGVSNIMLVTVKERTCEIGIRRALGAKPKQIVRQILSESIVLTVVAGLTGLCIATGIMALLAPVLANISNDFSMIDPFISFKSAMIATIIVIISGVFAGWLPVKHAMSIKAIDAIREE